jgi:hypothetical protein
MLRLCKYFILFNLSYVYLTKKYVGYLRNLILAVTNNVPHTVFDSSKFDSFENVNSDFFSCNTDFLVKYSILCTVLCYKILLRLYSQLWTFIQ